LGIVSLIVVTHWTSVTNFPPKPPTLASSHRTWRLAAAPISIYGQKEV